MNQQFKVTVFLSALKVNKSRTPTARKNFLLLKPTGHTWHYFICQLLDQQNLPRVPGAEMITSPDHSDQNIKSLISGISDWYISHFPWKLNLKYLANTYASVNFE